MASTVTSAAVDAGPGLGDELVQGAEAHGQRQHHDGRPAQPGGLDGGDQGPGGRSEQGDVRPRAHAPGLQPGAAIATASSNIRPHATTSLSSPVTKRIEPASRADWADSVSGRRA